MSQMKDTGSEEKSALLLWVGRHDLTRRERNDLLESDDEESRIVTCARRRPVSLLDGRKSEKRRSDEPSTGNNHGSKLSLPGGFPLRLYVPTHNVVLS